VRLGEAHHPASLLEDGLLDRLARLEAVCRLVGDHHDLATVGVQPLQCGGGRKRHIELAAELGDHHDLATVGVQPPQHRLRV
tara:strand:+ start:379 stop:624 length:246 start_codon:yes stop_codon:yes gene_type:complete